MKILRTVAAVRRFRRGCEGKLVLVPSMGALHAGHAELVRRARKLAGAKGKVVVSIFVNPTQFGLKEDFSRYPRPFADDARVCKQHGADAIFHPSGAEMYAADFSTWVNEEKVSGPLCGASRPGHFRGVCTVVLKLFTICQPTDAIFGLKDFQQCMVIQRMVRDLDLPVRLVFAPTVREPDGLAMSSRNAYLAPEERAQATVLRRALLAAEAAWKQGERSPAKLRRLLEKHIATAPLARLDYAEVLDAASLSPRPQAEKGTLLALAVFFGKTRLIDNLWLR